jgi:hypothetical protein
LTALCKVGSGYNDQALSQLQEQLEPHWRDFGAEIPPFTWASGYRPGAVRCHIQLQTAKRITHVRYKVKYVRYKVKYFTLYRTYEVVLAACFSYVCHGNNRVSGRMSGLRLLTLLSWK